MCLIGAFMMVPSVVCMPGLIGDGACAAKPVAKAPSPGDHATTSPEPAAPSAAATAAATPVKAAAALTSANLISASFDQLRGTAGQPTGGTTAAQKAVDTAVALAPDPAPVGPKARVVTTTPVRPDGTLIGAPAADAAAPDALGYAATGTVPLAPLDAVAPASTNAAAPATQVAEAAPADASAGSTAIAGADSAPSGAAPETAAVEPVPLPAPARVASATPAATPAAKPATAADAGPATVMIVGGSGVTVRAAPKTASTALFNLPAGQKVTVADRTRGWLHITDSQGRTGWAYSSLFRAGKAK